MRITTSLALTALLGSSAACGIDVILPTRACEPLVETIVCTDDCGRTVSPICRDDTWVCPGTDGICDDFERCGPGFGDCFDECGNLWGPECTDSGSWVCGDGGFECVPPDGSFDAQWSDGFGGPDFEEGSRVAIDGDGSVYVAGRFRQTLTWWDGETVVSAGGYDTVVVRYDAFGQRQWIAPLGEAGDDMPQGLAFHPDGSLVLAMSSAPTAAPTGIQSGDVSLMKLSKEDGTVTASVPLGITWGGGQETRMAIQPGNGDIVIAGSAAGVVSVAGGPSVGPVGGEADLYLARFNESLAPLWIRRFGGSGFDYARGLDIDSQGRVFLSGTFNSSQMNFDGVFVSASGDYDGFVVAFDGDGSALWGHVLESPSRASLDDLRAYGDGGVLVTGSLENGGLFAGEGLPAPAAERLPLVSRLDAQGEPVFVAHHGRMIPGSTARRYWRVDVMSSREVVLAGSTQEGQSGDDADILLAFLDPVSGTINRSSTFGDGNADLVGDLASNGETVVLVGDYFGAADFGQGPLPSHPEGSSFVASFEGAP